VGKQARSEHWKNEPDEHDFPAATDYLSLQFPDKVATALAETLRGAELRTRKAKDLLRASGLGHLLPDDAHVAKDLKKVKRGNQLSPVLLVRGRGELGVPLVIADGYHRICASYLIDENADIPCLLVDLV
jgi:hypothetical protein